LNIIWLNQINPFLKIAIKIDTTVVNVTTAAISTTVWGLSKMLNPGFSVFVESESNWFVETGSGSIVVSGSTSGVCSMLTKGSLLISSCSTLDSLPAELTLEGLLAGLEGPVPEEPEPPFVDVDVWGVDRGDEGGNCIVPSIVFSELESLIKIESETISENVVPIENVMKSLTEGESAVVLAAESWVDMISSTIPNSNGVLPAIVLVVMVSSKFVSSINERDMRTCVERVSLIEVESESFLAILRKGLIWFNHIIFNETL